MSPIPASAEQFIGECNGLRFTGYLAGPPHGELVLFLHGFPQFADAWLEVMPIIAGAGFRTVAFNQRGYSPEARPVSVHEYTTDKLQSDILGLADALDAQQFHLVAHDWGGLLAWQLAAAHPQRIRSLAVLATPHPDAFLYALETDLDQKKKSRYVEFFRMPGHVAEFFFKAGHGLALRRVYQGKVAPEQVQRNVERLILPGALSAALNWYRALDLKARIGLVSVPTFYAWGSEDMALGPTAANNTQAYVTGPYRFERLEGRSHWLVEEIPEWIATHVLQHLATYR